MLSMVLSEDARQRAMPQCAPIGRDDGGRSAFERRIGCAASAGSTPLLHEPGEKMDA
jgi:hypothetical protein